MTWLDLAPDDPFGVHNLPYCAFDAGPQRGEAEGPSRPRCPPGR